MEKQDSLSFLLENGMPLELSTGTCDKLSTHEFKFPRLSKTEM